MKKLIIGFFVIGTHFSASAATFHLKAEFSILRMIEIGLTPYQPLKGADDWEVRIYDDDTEKLLFSGELNQSKGKVRVSEDVTTNTESLKIRIEVIEHDSWHLWGLFGLIETGLSDDFKFSYFSISPKQTYNAYAVLWREDKLTKQAISSEGSTLSVTADGKNVGDFPSLSYVHGQFPGFTERPFEIQIIRTSPILIQ